MTTDQDDGFRNFSRLPICSGMKMRKALQEQKETITIQSLDGKLEEMRQVRRVGTKNHRFPLWFMSRDLRGLKPSGETPRTTRYQQRHQPKIVTVSVKLHMGLGAV